MPRDHDKNCFGIKHKISSIIICAVGFVFILTMTIILIAKPTLYSNMFNIGLSTFHYIVVFSVFLFLFLVFNIFLASSLYYEGPALMMVWLVGNALAWNMFLILVISIAIITSTRKKNSPLHESASCVAIRIVICICCLVVWLIMIIQVGRHWFALCEDILHQMEEEERRMGIRLHGSSMKNRIKTISMFSRYKKTDSHSHRAPSAISQRMPTFMQRFEKHHPASHRNKEQIQGWESRPKHFEIERNRQEPGVSSIERQASITSQQSETSATTSTKKIEGILKDNTKH